MLNNNNLSQQDRLELFADLIDVVEYWLQSKGFTASDFPNDDRENAPDEAIIYGTDYDILADGFSHVLGIARYVDEEGDYDYMDDIED